ncbi:MAG: glycosyltransferase family 9 protein [Chloroflexi bacterium]|nr:glycosyltransferase family 9 protein [Chloroflexota bacterium]
MERFIGQSLRPRPHIAVLFVDKPGAFVVVTPLLRGLKEKYPGCVVDYFSGPRTAELEAACPFVDSRYDLFRECGLAGLSAHRDARVATQGPYDLAINLDRHDVNAVATTLLAPRYVVGRAFRADGRSELAPSGEKVDRLLEEFWSAPDLLERYGDVLQSTFIAEIFCRMARVETDYARTEVPTAPPPFDVPDVLIATGATRSAKLWPVARWEEFIRRCTDLGLSVGLLGAAPQAQRAHYAAGDLDDHLLSRTPLVDLRGRATFPQVAGALARARACVTIDTGLMHLAYSVGTPTIALFGASPIRVWAPRRDNLHLVLPAEPCSMCLDNRFANEACLRPVHVCMGSIGPEVVVERLAEVIRRG